MINLGHYNDLTVKRHVDFGLYLTDNEGNEVLLPAKYVTETMSIGTVVNVFVYNDSDDRPVATTVRPFATVGQFAFLQVSAVTKFGAFMDWGLEKDLLVPFREQKLKMIAGGIYPVYVYLDDATKRIVASGKIEKFIGNRFPDLKHGDEVEVLPYAHTDIGYKVIVNDLYAGMIYKNELYHPVTIGERMKARVNRIREDGKIDIQAFAPQRDRVEQIAEDIVKYLTEQNGTADIGDKSSPEIIKSIFNCSKKDFKRAIGLLYKHHRIKLTDNGAALV